MAQRGGKLALGRNMISAAPPQAWWMESGHVAEMGDLFIIVIYICQLCDANSFDYLTGLQRCSDTRRNWLCESGGLDAVEPPQDTGEASNA